MGLTSDRNDPALREKDASGMQKVYLVMTEEERAKGFVRPVRDKYVHLHCGAVTTMAQAIAETYARQPDFYGGTYCGSCRGHFPVGVDGEFVWDRPRKDVSLGTSDKVGT